MFALDSAIRTAKLVKDDPLPAGRYWVDIWQREPDATDFRSWLNTYQKTLGWVRIEHSELFAPVDTYPGREFVIFSVLESGKVNWQLATSVGWPNTAPASIQSSDDTVQKPPPETTPNLFGSDGWVSSPWVWVGIGAASAAVLVYLVRR
jgi:hypothetical protein